MLISCHYVWCPMLGLKFNVRLQAALPVSADTTAVIVGALAGAEAAVAQQAEPGTYVAFPGAAALYTSLLTSRTPPGTLALATASAAALALTFQRSQVSTSALHACLISTAVTSLVMSS